MSFSERLPSFYDQSSLNQFGRHTPRILRRQLILELITNYIDAEKKVASGSGGMVTNECNPSIHRFHGALLFVDISGFTALSLRLSVEELKNHINEYFTTMLDIVDKHDGDVIKFAGDALFIIWETNAQMDHAGSDTVRTAFSTKIAVSKAVACGQEISEACGNHKVQLNTTFKAAAESHMLSARPSMFRAIMPMFRQAHSENPNSHPSKDDNVAYLNVHSGVTVGLMAGIDIGVEDRWEYFLVGQPLSSVATAEGLASMGDIVICPEAHAALHPPPKLPVASSGSVSENADRGSTKVLSTKLSSMKFSTLSSKTGFTLRRKSVEMTTCPLPDSELPCGCIYLKDGYCKVVHKASGSAQNRRKSRLKAQLEEAVHPDLADLVNINRLVEDIESDMEEAYSEFRKSFCNELKTKYRKISGNKEHTILSEQEEQMKQQFKKWCTSCLEDDIARHVHDVVRSSYQFKGTSRVGAFHKAIEDMWKVVHRAELQAGGVAVPPGMVPRGGPLNSPGGGPHNDNRPFSPPMLTKAPSLSKLTRKNSTSQKRLLEVQDSSGFTAEIRFVTVMFVKIDMGDMELLVDSTVSKKNTSQYRFLTKTVNEQLADQLLLDRLQSCIEALSQAFRTHGGQIRQFIVDDKGTVCIGTFGLRGAVSDDNAAAALETANTIVTKLQSLGLNSSIGVTVGRAYCGLVGSKDRHEYAVMGPSTNLSARLMCKAPPGGIICDIETRKRDRSHRFQALASIVAKGYSDPVGTFKPEFEDTKIEIVQQDNKKLSRLMTRKSYDFISTSGGTNVTTALRYVNAFAREPSMVLNMDLSTGHSFSESVREGSLSNMSQDSHDKDTAALVSRGESLASVGFSSKSSRNAPPVSMAVSHKIVRQFTRASFFVSVDAVMPVNNVVPAISATGGNAERALRTSANKMRINLFGRTSEIGRIFEFLFQPLVDSPYGVLKTLKRSYSKKGILQKSMDAGEPEALPTFKVDQEARFVGVIGPQGIGKTALISAIAQRVFTVSNTNANNNIHLFKSRYNSFQVNIPFNAWRPIFTEMLVRICRLLKSKNVASGKQRKRSVILGAAMNPLEVMIGLEFVMSLLPDEMQRLKPLLGELSLIPEEKDAVEALELSSQEKIIEITKLLLAILQIYPTVTNNLVFITMEDIHTFDLASLSLLHQVWTQLKGIVIIFSQRPMLQNSTGTGHLNNSLKSRSSTYSAPDDDISGGINIVAKFTEYFDDPSKYLEIELNQLDKTATTSLVKDVLEQFGLTRIESTMLNRVYDVCAGNPLYAFELAKSVVEQKDNLVDAIVFQKATKGIHCIRIEEVICHRFDQLNPSAQTILKMAAVICSNGSSFTLSMLSFIKHDAHYGPHHSLSIANGELPSTKKAAPVYRDYDLGIASDLLDILTKETFIRVVRNHTTTPAAHSSKSNKSILSPRFNSVSAPGSPNTNNFSRKSLEGISRKSTDSIQSTRLFVEGEEEPLTKEAIASNMYTFEFEISLEQFTIYDLLLDDQKQVIHECVAEFYQTRRENKMEKAGISTKNSPTHRTESNLAEEAFHWNRGSVWNSAMLCYYKASLLEIDDNKSNDLIRNAYAMYCSMKEQNDWEMADKKNVQVLESSEMTCEETKKLFHSAFNPEVVPKNNHGSSDFDMMTSLMSPRSNVLTLDRLFQIFEGDSELLTVGLQVHVLMAQRCMNKLDDSSQTRHLVEDALQMLLLTKNPFLLTAQYSQQIISALMKKERINVDAGEDISLPEESYFCVANFEELCYPIFSAFLQNYLYCPSHSIDASLKAIFIADQYFELSKYAENPVHIIQAMCHLCHIYIKLGVFTNAFAVFKEINEIYDAEDYERDLIHIYGSNRIPATYALVGQYLILVGEQEEAKKFVAEGVRLLQEQNSMTTVAASNIRMIATLSFLCRYDVAYDMWSDFARKRSESASEKDQAQESLATLYLEWLIRLRKYNAYLKSDELSLFDSDAEDIDEMLQKGEVEHVGKNAMLVFDYLSLHGKGLESVFLEMCEIKIIVLAKNVAANKALLDEYCNAAGNFARNTLAAKCSYPHELLFNKTATILTITQIVQTITSIHKNYLAACREKISLELLEQVKAEAGQYNFHYTLYVLGKLQKMLHDTESGSPSGFN